MSDGYQFIHRELDHNGNPTTIMYRKTTDFLDNAFHHALSYDDNGGLMIAIQKGLPELMESPYKEKLMDFISGAHKGKGKKLEQALRVDIRKQKVFDRIHYWKGRSGVAVWDAAATVDACGLVGSELHQGAKTIHLDYQPFASELRKGNPILEVRAAWQETKGRLDREGTK